MEKNLCLLTDSYKLSQWKQYPPNTTNIYSYYESRSGALFENTVFFGLQYIIQNHLMAVPSVDEIMHAEIVAKVHFGTPGLFNTEGWKYINKLGYLPITIKAVPEGSIIPEKNVLMTVENTDPTCYWLPNYLETLLSQVWYPSTVCTLSHYIKKMILEYLKSTGDPRLIDFKLHDFGFRGTTCVEQAGIGSLAHLVNFRGMDTLPAIQIANEFYGALMAGFSIPASEHSTITSWTPSQEVDAFSNMIDLYGDNSSMYSCVSDSFDIFSACRHLWGEQLKNKILAHKGTLVIRPDSGDQVEVTLSCLDILWEKFGGRINEKGYRVLHPKIRLIQGDGNDYHTIRAVLEAMKSKGWSADNVAFGMGGGLLQKMDRDTQRFAFKCSSAIVDGQEREVFKDPVTDRHGKASKAGRMSLIRDRDFNTYRTVHGSDNTYDELKTVFMNGRCIRGYKLSDIRELADQDL